jgi:hypothetical protein
MTQSARQVLLFRPTAIAIHDDRNMPRGVGRDNLCFGFFPKA